MYQIQRKGKIQEQVQLLDQYGNIAETIDIDLNVDLVASRVSKAYELLGMAQVALEKDPLSAECAEAYGKAVFGLLTVIFGEAGCEKIVRFYENSYTEMLIDLFPVINAVIDKVKAASDERKQQLQAMR